MSQVTRLRAREFRCYAAVDVAPGPGLTVVHGRNGAGKTNLLEALYFGLTGRSCRTSNEREMVRFGAAATRVEIDVRAADGDHSLGVGFAPGEPKRTTADGAAVDRLLDVPGRPLVSVFLPDRLELVKGPPSLRRAHVDQVVAALWPARAETRRAYAGALAQRNALLGRIRSGRASASSLPAWDAELARHGVALRDDRRSALDALSAPFADVAAELGLSGAADLRYRPRSDAASAEELAAELAARVQSDLERGFTGHGPHRDDVLLRRDGRDLRAYGSQGEQRVALLALLLAERRVLAAARGGPPLLLLDDVMSELDATRRDLLVGHLEAEGQSVVTTTDLAHVPRAAAASVTRIAVADGAVLQEAGEAHASGAAA